MPQQSKLDSLVSGRSMLNFFRRPLLQIANKNYVGQEGTKKPESYYVAYEKHFAHLRNKPIRILELGVNSGASLLMWREYFPKATIAGLDILEKPPLLTKRDDIYFVRGDQADPKSLDRTAAHLRGEADIIIDDASHMGALTYASFEHLFPNHLKSGGWYIIEDWATPIIPGFPDGAPCEKYTGNESGFGAGMFGALKRITDQLIIADTTTSKKAPVGEMTIYPHIAFIRKL